MKKTALTASTLRILLITGLLLLLIIIGIGFYRVQAMLRGYAKETSQLNAEAAMGEQNVATLKKIKQYLEDHTEERERAASIVAESKQYKYQNEIIQDISAFANASGITITGYTFSEAAPATSGTTTPTTPPPGTSTAPAVSGLKSKTVNIAVASPVGYVKLLNFIHRIEQNTTKMQIASVSLSRGGAGEESSNSNQITTDAFDIEVYVR